MQRAQNNKKISVFITDKDFSIKLSYFKKKRFVKVFEQFHLNSEQAAYICYKAHHCDRQTDRPTDYATRSVTIGRIYMYVCSTAIRPNNINEFSNKIMYR